MESTKMKSPSPRSETDGADEKPTDHKARRPSGSMGLEEGLRTMLRSRFLCLTTSATVLILLVVACGIAPDERLPWLAADATTMTSTADDTAADVAPVVGPGRFLLRSLGFLAGGLAVTLLIGAGNRRVRGFAIITSMLVMLAFAGGAITTWIQDGWPGWPLAALTVGTGLLGLWSFWLFLLGDGQTAVADGEEEEEEEEEEEAEAEEEA